jgi:UDP-N-acetylglucosamine 2-epimerase (non-hydrolysing)
METLSDIAAAAPVLFPVHPRTRRQLEAAGLSARAGSGLHLLDPLGYLDFLALEERAAVVVTDSGGVQEETTYLGVPCFTLRANTERPVTVTLGTNTLVGADLDGLTAEVQAALAGRGKRGQPVPLWDGRAGERIARILAGVDGDRVDEDSVEAQRTYS